MSEKTEPEPAPETSAGGASWLIVILIMVLALAAGAGGTYFFLAPSLVASGTSEEEGEPEEALNPGLAFQERLVSLEPFVVNIAGEGYPKFLKVKIELEAESVAAKDELDARRPQLRDTTILLLASRRLPAITEFEGQALLKDDLRDRINQIVGAGMVASVMFTDLVVQ